MPEMNYLNPSMYGNGDDFIEIRPRLSGNELIVDICRVVERSVGDPRCVNVVIPLPGGEITIAYSDTNDDPEEILGIL